MKLQYLGDSKDAFKWDYHDFIIRELKYSQLNIALMMTRDDGGSHGSSQPSLFPAPRNIVSYCESLKRERRLDLLLQLPNVTRSSYKVVFHDESEFPVNSHRKEYFDGFLSNIDQLILVDPDNGFEPRKSCSEKHVRFSELEQILQQVSENTVVSVFQHFRRKPFSQDFREIKERLISGAATAVYWHSLMFVQVARSAETIELLYELNKSYAASRSISTLDPSY